MASGIAIGVLAVLLAGAAAGLRIARKQQRRTAKLFEIGLRLNSTIRRKDLLELIMETASRELDAEGSSVILLDASTGELYFEVATGDKTDEVKEIRLKPGEGIAGWVASSRESVLIADAASDPRWSNRVAVRAGVPTRNMLCVPVVLGDKTLGVLQVINKRGTRPFDKRDLRLLELIASPAAIALENMQLYDALVKSMEELRETTAAKERMESELKIARSIQMSFLPGESFRAGRADVHARLVPAREVGGDFFHFMELDEDRLLICLGDVSDKGMPAALFMSGLMIWIRAKAREVDSPAGIVAAINRELSTEDSTMFATIFLAILDVNTGEMRFCDGGHCTPLVVSGDGARELPSAKGMPIGVFGEAEYEDSGATLAPGETLVLYTDGITEAENGRGEWFAMDRLREALSGSPDRSPREVAQALLEEVGKFAGGHPQTDDIAVMAVRFVE